MLSKESKSFFSVEFARKYLQRIVQMFFQIEKLVLIQEVCHAGQCCDELNVFLLLVIYLTRKQGKTFENFF